MTKKQIAELVGIAMAGFPALQNRDPGPMVAAWQFVLDGLEYDLALAALREVLREPREFPPAPGAVLSKAREMLSPEQLSWPEAFNAIIQVIEMGRKDWQVAQLPESVRLVAEQFNWNLTRDGGDQARFRDIYKEVVGESASRHPLALGSGGVASENLRLAGRDQGSGEVGGPGR